MIEDSANLESRGFALCRSGLPGVNEARFNMGGLRV